MGSLLKYIIIALFAIMLIYWFKTVFTSCNAPKVNTEKIDSAINGLGEADGEATADEADLEDLYVEASDASSGDADITGDQSATDESDEEGLEAETDGGEATTDSSDEPTEEAAPASPSVNSGSTFGKYLVITGSYLSESNAKIMARQLKKSGYNAAEVVNFDLSQYYSVTAGRYSNHAEARSVKRQLDKSGMEAYVHKMRGKRVGE